MTFEGPTATTWGKALAALRDKVSGMANWALEDTSANGDAESIADGEWFVISAPNGECFRIETLANAYDGAIL
ncbi:hypothetical protein, partial [Halomicrobium mukohataei]|uniref:hypothetical protein n=1 Tax=Halomicrobium mukohataei TaxID=57705 RepID=UPI003D6633D6